jgi:4-diphosphocytidyl-2-C-methyl-D-erythritol kinase
MERFWHPFPGHVGCLYNDFELVAPRECLQIKEKLLELDAEGALLCGSGSAVFGLYTTQERAEKAQEHLVQQGYTRSYVVPTLTRRESLWMS